MSVYESSLTLLLGICIIFLQEGMTYYVSFQCLALILLVLLFRLSNTTLYDWSVYSVVILLFSSFVLITALLSPQVISQNSSNITMTTLAIIVYASLSYGLINLRIMKPYTLLSCLRVCSGHTILVLCGLMVIEKLGWVSALTREALFFQNARLITNFTGMQGLQNEFAYRTSVGLLPRIDLFYGESSYLAIVIFSCLGCYMLTTRMLNLASMNHSQNIKIQSKLIQATTIFLGIIALLYIKSLSSVIYALLVSLLFFKEQLWQTLRFKGIILVVLPVLFYVFNYTDVPNYLIHRLSMGMEQSVSLQQRFGLLFEFNLVDYLFGLKDESRLPAFGIHNGLFYLIAISGTAGLIYLVAILVEMIKLLKTIPTSVIFYLLLFLAQIMQNGAIFSPNKVLLYALILLPLSSVRTLKNNTYSLNSN